jgi:hypothetical protein
MKAAAGGLTTDRESPRFRLFQAPHACAVALWILSLLLFRQPLVGLVKLALGDENSSHLPLVPLINAALLWLQRRRLFRSTYYFPRIGISLLFPTVALRYLLKTSLGSGNGTDRLSIEVEWIVLV